MTTPQQQEFAYTISIKAQYDELRRQRALGADWIDAYTRAWRVMDEVYALVFAIDKPAVYQQPKMIMNPISRRGTKT